MTLRRRPRSAALMRLGYRVAYRLLHVWTLVAQPHGVGVKCLLTDTAGRTLFVRHHYGERSQWELPGGGVKRGEAAVDGARREAWEELGADVVAWREAGSATTHRYGKHEQLALFAAPWPGGPVRPDPVEIASFRWFSLDTPPSPLGPTTVTALAVVRSAGA